MMLTKIQLYALHLIKGVGIRTMTDIINSKLSIDDLVKLDESNLRNIIKNSKARKEFRKNFNDYLNLAQLDFEDFDHQGIYVIAITDDGYPKQLKKIKDPPFFLYCRGNIRLLNNKKPVAIIGTRDSTKTTGDKIARKTAEFIADDGFNIVSRLSKGIDTSSIEGALNVNGKTTAILVDLLDIYPKENTKLANRIINNNGLLISEYKPGTTVTKNMFAERNRLVSGLCIGFFIIETSINGTTMKIVELAKEQNKLIFCPDLNQVPNYNKNSFSGVETLLKNNEAIPYINAAYKDVVDLLNNHRII